MRYFYSFLGKKFCKLFQVLIKTLIGNDSVPITATADGVNDGICDESDLPRTIRETRGYDFVANSTEASVEFVSDGALETAGFKLVFTTFVHSPGC